MRACRRAASFWRKATMRRHLPCIKSVENVIPSLFGPSSCGGKIWVSTNKLHLLFISQRTSQIWLSSNAIWMQVFPWGKKLKGWYGCKKREQFKQIIFLTHSVRFFSLKGWYIPSGKCYNWTQIEISLIEYCYGFKQKITNFHQKKEDYPNWDWKKLFA